MKVVVVTGGTWGLGLAIVCKLLAEGYKLVAIGRNCSPELQALIQESAGNLAFEAYDFRNTGEYTNSRCTLGASTDESTDW